MQVHSSVLELARIFWGNGLSKTGSFLAAIGASALLGWLDQVVGHILGINIRQPPEWACLAVMITGVGLLVWGNSRTSGITAANPHDVDLMGRFRGLVNNNLLDFLRNHNFDTPWMRSRLDPIAEIAEVWRGARFEFHDSDLNAALSRVKASANHLEELIAYGSWPARSNAAMQTTKTDEDYRTGTQPSTIAKIKDMNTRASDLVRDIDALERLALAKLR